MKINKDGTEYTIETPRYHYHKCDGITLFPKSVVLKAVFTGESIIQGSTFIDWSRMMLNNKIFIPVGNVLSDEHVKLLKSVSSLPEPILMVDSTDEKYLLNTFFTIVNTLLTNPTLKSLEWIE